MMSAGKHDRGVSDLIAAAKKARVEAESSLAQLDFDLGLDADPTFGLDGEQSRVLHAQFKC